MKPFSSLRMMGFAVLVAITSTFLTMPQAWAQNYACIFYFSGFGDTLYAQLSPTGDSWIMKGQNPPYGPYPVTNFWAKPLWAATHGDGTIKNNYRFYFNGNPNQPNTDLLNWHADLLTKAGIDFVVLDFTNGAQDFANGGPSYISGTKALCNAWQARMNAGLPTPKIVFFVRDEAGLATVESTFFNVYRSDLFFNYLNKKLLLVAMPNANLGANDPRQPAVPTNGRFANYTARHTWGLDNSGTYWQFKTSAATPPPPFTYNGQPEQMCVPVATQSSYMTTDGVNPAAGAVGRQNGAYFNTYFTAAQQRKPKFTFIHSWNEWHAQNLGSQSTPAFVDQWLTEYSSDIEPMAGGHGYQYYDLMAEQIGRLKGTFPIQHGRKYVIKAVHSGKALDDAGWSTANGNQMIQWDVSSAAVQQWTAYDLGGGYWRFVNVHSGKSLEVGGYSVDNRGKVQQWDWVGHNWQQWSLRPAGNDRWKIVNRGSGLMMEVDGGTVVTNAGALIQQWTDLNATNQQWTFQLIP